jgi:DNA-binding beta-propeller fold protein YncE
VLYVPGFDKIFAASAQGRIYIFNGKTHKLEKSVDFGADADNLRWDPVRKLVLVGFGEEDGGIASIDPATEQRVGAVLKTGSHPESFQIELHGPMVYVNCPHDAGQVVEAINRDTGQATKWPLHGVSGNYAMALDEANHRLFTVTRRIPMLIVFNTETGEQVAIVPGIVGESDDVYFDAVRKRIYVISGQGYVSVVQQIDPDRYGLIANVPTKVGARTGYWDAREGVLYIGVQAQGDAPAQMLRFEAEDY